MAGLGRAVTGTLKGSAIAVGATVGLTAVGAGSYAGYLKSTGMSNEDILATMKNAPSDVIDYFNTQVGEGQSRAGMEAGAEGLYAFAEQVGVLWNNIMGGEAGLGLINWARAAQTNQPPMVLDASTGKLVIATVSSTPAASGTTTPIPGTPAANLPSAPSTGADTVQVTTDFGKTTQYTTQGGTYETPNTYADAFKDAAEAAGVELDGNLTLEKALEIAVAADPASSEEFGAIMADSVEAGLFQQSYNEAKEAGIFTSYEGNISGFFQRAHDSMVANTNAPITTVAQSVRLELTAN